MMDFPQNGLEEEKLPSSAVAFRRYVTGCNLELLDIALKTGVRYSTVWCIWKGYPIKSEHELPIRQGLLRMTGIPYTAPILFADEPERTIGPLRDH